MLLPIAFCLCVVFAAADFRAPRANAHVSSASVLRLGRFSNLLPKPEVAKVPGAPLAFYLNPHGPLGGHGPLGRTPFVAF